MRVVMSFVVRDEDAAGVETWRKVLPGPAWGAMKAEALFRLMAFYELDGRKSLELVAIGLARARAELAALSEAERKEVGPLLESLASWATVARMRGAEALAWTTDF